MQVSADRTERDSIPAQHNLVAGYLKKTLSGGWSVSAHTHTHRRFYHIHAPRLQQFVGKVGLGKKYSSSIQGVPYIIHPNLNEKPVQYLWERK